jgi:hypothetical protein
VQSVTRLAQMLNRAGGIEIGQNHLDFVDKFWANLAPVTVFVQSFQTAMFEVTDHEDDRSDKHDLSIQGVCLAHSYQQSGLIHF